MATQGIYSNYDRAKCRTAFADKLTLILDEVEKRACVQNASTVIQLLNQMKDMRSIMTHANVNCEIETVGSHIQNHVDSIYINQGRQKLLDVYVNECKMSDETYRVLSKIVNESEKIESHILDMLLIYIQYQCI